MVSKPQYCIASVCVSLLLFSSSSYYNFFPFPFLLLFFSSSSSSSSYFSLPIASHFSSPSSRHVALFYGLVLPTAFDKRTKKKEKTSACLLLVTRTNVLNTSDNTNNSRQKTSRNFLSIVT